MFSDPPPEFPTGLNHRALGTSGEATPARSRAAGRALEEAGLWMRNPVGGIIGWNRLGTNFGVLVLGWLAGWLSGLSSKAEGTGGVRKD